MAASKSCYRYLTGVNNHHNSLDSVFELNESDVWYSDHSSSTELFNSVSAAKMKPSSPPSVPMNVPDWSKILKGEYNNNQRWDCDGGDDDVYGGGSWVPPHEYLAKKRIASLSMQEGVGRTLKGRDLRRVRNAIWEKTGFQD